MLPFVLNSNTHLSKSIDYNYQTADVYLQMAPDGNKSPQKGKQTQFTVLNYY